VLVLFLYLLSKAVPVTGLGGLYGYEIVKIPHCLENRLVNGSYVVSLKRRLPFTPEITSVTYFCQRLSKSQGHSAAERIC
jgi:hypothetical protein